MTTEQRALLKALAEEEETQASNRRIEVYLEEREVAYQLAEAGWIDFNGVTARLTTDAWRELGYAV